MVSTIHVHPTAGSSAADGESGRFTMVLLALVMLGLGFGLGSLDWSAANRTAVAGHAPIAAPQGAAIYDDWRGNSAGVSRNR